MKKIVIFSKSIDGGTGTFVINLLDIKNLLRKQYSLKAYVFEKPKYRNVRSKKFVFLHKKSFYPNRYSLINSLKYFVNDLSNLKKILDKEHPDLIISVNNYTNILIALARILFLKREKIFLTFHNNLLMILRKRCSPIIRKISQLIFPYIFRSTTNICVSKSLANELKLLMNLSNVKVIPNGINLRKLTINLKKNNTGQNIISVGRFDEQKDFFTLLNAFDILNKKIKKSSLTLIGDGMDYGKILEHIKKLNLNNKVKLLKWQNNVGKYLKKSDLFVFSSNYEGFAYIIVEAMSYGLPIISTNTPYGPGEILDNGKYGYLVPMKNDLKMAKYIYDLLVNKQKYYYFSKKSLERAKYYSLAKMLEAYTKLVKEAI